jgi:hypothetical protein
MTGHVHAGYRTTRSVAVAIVFMLLAAAAYAAQDAVAHPGAMKAAAAPLIAAPGHNAVITRTPVRVEVRAPARARRVRIHLGRRDITSRFRAEGALRVARLRVRDGLRYGRNHLFVLAERRGRRALTNARTFVLARRSDGLVHLRLRRGVRLTAQIDIGGPPGIARADLRSRVALVRRLAVIRRERTVRVWLNGRRVERAAAAPRRTRHTLVLSATHGLRYGVNRLRVKVVEPRQGRYALVKRRFRVRRDRPLAAAGWDRAARPNVRVRLGGGAKAARGGRLRHRWTIVRRPSGSRARLAAAGTARPRLTPDRPGRYLLRQHVFEHARSRASASQVGRAAVDEVQVVANPPSALVEIGANAQAYDPRGITLGNAYYHMEGPGSYIQWLMLDRATLQPTRTGNSWCCGDGANSLDSLTDALRSSGLDQLVIISIPAGRITLFQDQYDDFNAALQIIGVDPLDDATLNADNTQLVIVGVPYAGKGSGWVRRRGGGSNQPGAVPRQGWLMPDGSVEQASGALRFRFQPERLAFNTRAQSTANTNRMTIAGQSVDASLPQGQSGFHVVELDPRDLSIVNNYAYASFEPGSVAAAIDAARGRSNYVAVQTIGAMSPGTDPEMQAWWGRVADALAAMGANPDLFNRVNGSYAFFGGPPLTRGEVAQSSSAVVVDPTSSPPTHEPGALRGRAIMRPDSYFAPALPDGATASGTSLYDIVFSPPTPWPYTQGAAFPQQVQAGCPPPGNDTGAYASALAYITRNLPDLDRWAPDARQAYLGNSTLTYSDSKTDLSSLSYPGDGKGFGEAEFCNLKAELQLEFDWLDNTRGLINTYETALIRGGAQQGADVKTEGDKIRNAVAPPNDDLVTPILYLLQSIAEVGEELAEGAAVEAPPIAMALGLVATSYDLGSAIASSAGMPVGEQIRTNADDLATDVSTNVANTADALDSIRAVAISDYGRLRALSNVATAAADVTVTDLANRLTVGADRYFASELMPIAYWIWRLGWPGLGCDFYEWGPAFEDAPNSTWVPFLDAIEGDDPVVDGLPAPSTNWLVLNDGYYEPGYYAPASLTDPMWSPISQNGYGIEKSTWFWEQPDRWEDSDTCPPT